MSLPQSALPCSSHLSPMHRLYHLHILHYHFALCTFITHTHTHTQAQDHYLALPILTSTRTLYIFFCTIHTSSTRSLFTFLLDTDTVKIIALCTIGFPVSGNTRCENVLPMCMYICSPYVYVYVIYVCMSVRCISVYVYKLLDDLHFPRD